MKMGMLWGPCLAVLVGACAGTTGDRAAVGSGAESPSTTLSDHSVADADTDRFDELGTSETQVRAFLESLGEGLESEDYEDLEPLLFLPIDVVDCDGQTVTLVEGDLARWARIFSPLGPLVRSTAAEDLDVTYKGIRLGKGEVWINVLCDDESSSSCQLGVVAINPRCSQRAR